MRIPPVPIMRLRSVESDPGYVRRGGCKPVMTGCVYTSIHFMSVVLHTKNNPVQASSCFTSQRCALAECSDNQLGKGSARSNHTSHNQLVGHIGVVDLTGHKQRGEALFVPCIEICPCLQ